LEVSLGGKKTKKNQQQQQQRTAVKGKLSTPNKKVDE